jgi:REP element-mobilizing transposase RayT
MGNHFHFILKPEKNESLSEIMKWILSVFALKFNRTFGLIGHVFYDRFKSKIIHSFQQFLTTFIYIANNPVRAKIVESPTEYEYNGITYIKKGKLDLLERPPDHVLRRVLTRLHQT